MRVSPRFAWPAAGLLLAALVPTALNVYRPPPPLAPGTLAARLPETLPAFGPSEPDRNDPDWVALHFGARDYVSRRYGDLRLFAARAHDAKKLFHFPELALSYGRSATARRVEELDGGLPAHVLEFRSATNVHLAAYVLLYGDRPVRDPIPFFLSTLPERFLGRRAPATLVYVQGDAAPGGAEALAARLRGLLAAAAEACVRG